jgi:carboxyl-terminal processing protease
MTDYPRPSDSVAGAPLSEVLEETPRGTRQGSALVALFLVAAIGAGALFVSGFALGRLAGATPGTSDGRQDLFRPFWDAYNDVSVNYVGEIDPSVLVQGAIKGIFEALDDPYSSYMTEEEYRASLTGLSGEFEGVGIEMTTRDLQGEPCATISATCQLVVTRVIRGSPAIAAGIQVDDVLLAVDGKSTQDQTLELVVPSIRGARGTAVLLTLERAGQPVETSVVRDVIRREDVRSEIVADGRIGYLKVLGFSSASADDLHNMLSEVLANENVDALILDLRDDPGGYVDAAQRIASEFVTGRPLYWEQTATGEPIAQQPIGTGVATDLAVPMVVLVNAGTASASEIVAAALQDNDRALLVGTTTFGKGTIQEFKELTGAGGYRLSVRKWLTPDQTWIHGVGLTPDYLVEGPTDPEATEDPQLERAIEVLLGQLAGQPLPTTSPAPASPVVTPVPSA